MRIQEVEKQVGISKKNIRFYEEQGLLSPGRDPENGYRDYSEEDVQRLRKVKLLRKLFVPIEEIRKMTLNHLTLADCMEMHLVSLAREEKNIKQVQVLCREISEREVSLQKLDAAMYLEQMEELEKGGTRFMNVDSHDRKKRKKTAPVIFTAIAVFVMLLLIAVMCWGYMTEPIPAPFFLFLIAIPVLVIVGVIVACVQRMKEIEGGEEDEARKY